MSIGPLLPLKKFIDLQVRISFQKNHAESASQWHIYPYIFLHFLLEVVHFLQTHFSILNPSTKTKSCLSTIWLFPELSLPVWTISFFPNFSVTCFTTEMHFKLSLNCCQLLRFRTESMVWAKLRNRRRKGKEEILSEILSLLLRICAKPNHPLLHI